MKHAIVAYEISLAERGSPSHTLPLDNFDGKGASVLRLFASYIKAMPSTHLIAADTRHYGLPHDVQAAGNTLRFKIVSGTSGILSLIKNPADTGPGYQRAAADIEQFNFNVYVVQPPDAHIGFLLIETVAGRSVGQAFRTVFIKEFRRLFPTVTITLTRTAETDAWKAAERAGQEASVKSITAIHRGIEASVMKDMGVGATARPVGEYKRILNFRDDPQPTSILKSTREFFFPPASTGIDAEGGTISLKEGDDGGADEDEADELIALVSYAGGTTQSIRVTGARPPLITYPIGSPTGDVVDEDFHRESRVVAKSLVGQTDGKLPAKWDTGEWNDFETIAPWEVADFAKAAGTTLPSE